jgi:hypothetical protein
MDCPCCGSEEFELVNETAHTLVFMFMEDIKARGGFQEALYSMTNESREMMWDELYDMMEEELVKFKQSLKA